MKTMIPLRKFLYTLALLAVLADSMLIPFYPQFFDRVYQENSLLVTGIFIAVCRLAMIISFPFWSWLTKHIEPIRILIFTQGAAGLLCIVCSFAHTLNYFFIVTVLIELLKSSYLLLYPYLVKTAVQDKRAAAISAISIIMNVGIVISTAIGGYFLEFLQPKHMLIVVGCIDMLQMLISGYVYVKKIHLRKEQEQILSQQETKNTVPALRNFIILCAITLFFYFSMVIIRPYFTLFLTDTYGGSMGIGIAAFIFIIPNMVALAMAPFMVKLTSCCPLPVLLLTSCGLMIIGIGMQILPGEQQALIAGRILYGAGMFITEVIVDMMIFNLSTDRNIFRYYSYVNVMQSISVLIAPLAAAFLVSTYGQYYLFIAALLATAGMSILVLLLSVQNKKQIIALKN